MESTSDIRNYLKDVFWLNDLDITVLRELCGPDLELVYRIYKSEAVDERVEKNISSMMNKLGCMYERGNGVKLNYRKAKEWYEKAIETGNSDAMKNLGDMYYLGRGGEQNYQKAKGLYEKAIENDNASAMNSLGYMYERGYGVDQNHQKAKKLYKAARGRVNKSCLILLVCDTDEERLAACKKNEIHPSDIIEMFPKVAQVLYEERLNECEKEINHLKNQICCMPGNLSNHEHEAEKISN